MRRHSSVSAGGGASDTDTSLSAATAGQVSVSHRPFRLNPSRERLRTAPFSEADKNHRFARNKPKTRAKEPATAPPATARPGPAQGSRAPGPLCSRSGAGRRGPRTPDPGPRPPPGPLSRAPRPVPCAPQAPCPTGPGHVPGAPGSTHHLRRPHRKERRAAGRGGKRRPARRGYGLGPGACWAGAGRRRSPGRLELPGGGQDPWRSRFQPWRCAGARAGHS